VTPYNQMQEKAKNESEIRRTARESATREETLKRSQEEGARNADLRKDEAAIGEGEESKNQTLENGRVVFAPTKEE